jgi:thioredoxin reductase
LLGCFGLDYSTYSRFNDELNSFDKIGSEAFLIHSSTTFEDIAETTSLSNLFFYNKKEKNNKKKTENQININKNINIIENENIKYLNFENNIEFKKEEENKINIEDLILNNQLLKENEFPLESKELIENGYIKTIDLKKKNAEIIGMDCEFVLNILNK